MIDVSVSTLSVEGFAETDFFKTFTVFPELGFRNIEFNLWSPSDLTPAMIRHIKEGCDSSGLKPISVFSSGFGGRPVADVAHKIRMMEAANELGCNRIVMSGGPRGKGVGLDGIIDVLNRISSAAEEMDMLVCLENHAFNELENIEDYETVLAGVPCKRVGICIDTGHFDAAGVDMFDLIDRLGERVNHIHVKDNETFGTKNFVKFGDGTTDNHGVVKKMISLGYEGYINIELSPEITGGKSALPKEDLIGPREMFEQYVRP